MKKLSLCFAIALLMPTLTLAASPNASPSSIEAAKELNTQPKKYHLRNMEKEIGLNKEQKKHMRQAGMESFKAHAELTHKYINKLPPEEVKKYEEEKSALVQAQKEKFRSHLTDDQLAKLDSKIKQLKENVEHASH